MVLLEFSMAPFGEGESLSEHVSRSLGIIDQSGVDYRLTAMGTILEGDWDEVFGVVKSCFEEMSKECNRISVSLKVDYRRGPKGRLTSKLDSVERRLGRKVKK